MPPKQSNKYIKYKVCIINILKLLKNKEFFFLKVTVCVFKISYFILCCRHNVNNLKYNSHEIQQNFINVEESILV